MLNRDQGVYENLEQKPDPTQNENPYCRQVGGSHYKHWTIEPMEFILKNNLSYIQGNVIKRILRYDKPGGKLIEDLEKIIHEVEFLKYEVEKGVPK